LFALFLQHSLFSKCNICTKYNKERLFLTKDCLHEEVKRQVPTSSQKCWVSCRFTSFVNRNCLGKKGINISTTGKSLTAIQVNTSLLLLREWFKTKPTLQTYVQLQRMYSDYKHTALVSLLIQDLAKEKSLCFVWYLSMATGQPHTSCSFTCVANWLHWEFALGFISTTLQC